MTLIEMRQVTYVYERLKPVARQLHRLDERACNGTSESLAKRDEKREINLMKSAADLAGQIGLTPYHQSDPRGCSLYVIDKTMDDSNYHNGIAIQT